MGLTPSVEDYLEAIWVISRKKTVVRVKDLMNYFNYKVSSINNALKILLEKELVVHEKYSYIELTKKGIEEAKKIYKKHETLTKFFNEILGVDIKIATEDACKIEHYINKKTINRLRKFTDFIESCPKGTPLWLSHFNYFAKYGVHPESKKKNDKLKNKN